MVSLTASLTAAARSRSMAKDTLDTDVADALIGIDTLAMLQGRLRVLRGREAAK